MSVERWALNPRTSFRQSTWTLLTIVSLAATAAAQTAPPGNNDSIRVSVTVNPDGTRTSFQFDTANHKATAMTTDAAGKTISKTVYRLDQQDRFGTSVTFSADGRLHHKSIYKYDARGRMEQETQLDRNDAPFAKIVYSYDVNGRQTGYSVFDANGKLMGQTSGGGAAVVATPTGSPKKKR